MTPVTGRAVNKTAISFPDAPTPVVVEDERAARCCFTKARCAHFLQPVRKAKRPAVWFDTNLTVFVSEDQGPSDPMIAGNGDLVSGERYRGCDFRAAPAWGPCG